MEESIDVKLLEALRRAARPRKMHCPPMMEHGAPMPGPGPHMPGPGFPMPGPGPQMGRPIPMMEQGANMPGPGPQMCGQAMMEQGMNMPGPQMCGPMHMHGMHGHGMHRHHGGKRLPRERILMILLAHEEGMHQKELAEEMKIGPSSLSELIDKLESDRYVERNVDPEDRRSTLITLTEKGKARAFEAEDMRRSAAEERFAALTQEEKETLLSLLEKIAV